MGYLNKDPLIDNNWCSYRMSPFIILGGILSLIFFLVVGGICTEMVQDHIRYVQQAPQRAEEAIERAAEKEEQRKNEEENDKFHDELFKDFTKEEQDVILTHFMQNLDRTLNPNQRKEFLISIVEQAKLAKRVKQRQYSASMQYSQAFTQYGQVL